MSSETISRARKGDWDIYLTPKTPVPKSWWPPLKGARVLCLASGGGQQGPILSAAGAKVTVYDNSPKQLGQDRKVADRDCLSIELVEGDMADLSHFSNLSFDLIVNPASTMFSEKVLPVWRESFRALDHGGVLVIKGAFADGKPLLAIPNYARLNRGGRSIVWMKEQ